MKLYYSEPVNPCHFTIKCIPRDTSRQKLANINIQMDPYASYTRGYDGNGNEKITGSVRTPHDHYFLDVSGQVEVSSAAFEEEVVMNRVGMYRYSYGKTVPGQKITEYKNRLALEIRDSNIEGDLDKCLYVMHNLHSDFIYDPMPTDVTTSAEEAFLLGRGVCQDYAHIYICILRAMGIAARYVVGLMIGEGKSHAWVEALIGDKWVGIDPTNDQLVDENYIKFGHGRDASDCKINLGIMYGGGDQRQEITVKVWKDN